MLYGLTSVHDPLGVHVVEGGAELHEVLPHRPLRYQLLKRDLIWFKSWAMI